MASVWDHHHNYLIKLDLARNSQHVIHQNGDYDKIIVDIVQHGDKAIICDRQNSVKIFVGGIKVHEAQSPCFFQRLDYYAMSKVLSVANNKLYYIHNDNRGRVVEIDLSVEGYPETLLAFPQRDLFQVVYNDHIQLVGVGEESGLVSFYNLNRRAVVENVQLETGYLYRTIDSKRGITIVNGVRNSVYNTDNVQIVIGRDSRVATKGIISFEGGHLGKYIHKIRIGFLDNGMPLIGMISHHFEDAHFYLYGIDYSKKLVLLQKLENLHKKWQWDLLFIKDGFLVSSSDGSITEIGLKVPLTA